ncbi:hypothetical protein EJ110_NYTH52797 [Nymphaea thermarum]|nr:hypothetical protein EJ110_NYTH52797 [Nymphaea thermarum]
MSLGQTLSVGQEFADVDECRRMLKETAIAFHFDLRMVKSDRCRVIAKCAKEGCPWRVHAAKCPSGQTFTIRTLRGEHTCEGVRDSRHQQASVSWVAKSVESWLRADPRYKPNDILKEIRERHGVAVSYMQAWRGKERSMAAVHGSYEEGFRLLPAYCEQIRKTNPGSIALVVATGQENHFHRLFISYRASIYGFIHGCRPLLELDRAYIKSKYLGTLLCAAAADGDGSVFPLAFGIVDIETDENWMWFLSELRKLLGINTENMPRLTILSDRQQGIVEAVETHFPTAYHGFCLRYLSENFCDEFKNTKLLNLFWNAAYALTTVEFGARLGEMEEISRDAVQWLNRYPPSLWAVAYFEGVRYGHLTLGITQLLSTWVSDSQHLPIIKVMESFRARLTDCFSERRDRGAAWSAILVPSAEKRMSEAIADSRCYQVLRANEVEFEIVSTERTNIVDIRTRCCSCRRWQLFGLPCAHATAALLSCGQNARLFAESCFSVASYRETYSQTISPIPDKSLWKDRAEGSKNGGASVDIVIRPPKTRRPPGRPKKKLVRAETLTRAKRIVSCGRCNQSGHTRKKCRSQILDQISLG